MTLSSSSHRASGAAESKSGKYSPVSLSHNCQEDQRERNPNQKAAPPLQYEMKERGARVADCSLCANYHLSLEF